ncbi:MAG: hypothetical protein ACYS6W_07935 [Planctomycetota bacterium]|jgi:hypothetical protein
MNAENEENLKELFAKFVGAEQAERAAEDFCKAEQILSEYPAPAPDDVLIADIKSQIAEALPSRQVNVFRRIAYKTAVVAAAVIVIAAISVRLFDKGPGKVTYASIIPEALWESDDISADYVELAILNAEIEQIEGEVLTLELGENGGNGSRAVTELEMELIAIDSDFW